MHAKGNTIKGMGRTSSLYRSLRNTSFFSPSVSLMRLLSPGLHWSSQRRGVTESRVRDVSPPSLAHENTEEYLLPLVTFENLQRKRRCAGQHPTRIDPNQKHTHLLTP